MHLDIHLLLPSGPLVSSRVPKSPGNTVKTHFLISSAFFTCKLSIGCSWCHSFENPRNRCIVSAISFSAVALFLPPSFVQWSFFPCEKHSKNGQKLTFFVHLRNHSQSVLGVPKRSNFVKNGSLDCQLSVIQ